MTSQNWVGFSSLSAIAFAIHAGSNDGSLQFNQMTWGVRDISKWGKAIQPFD